MIIRLSNWVLSLLLALSVFAAASPQPAAAASKTALEQALDYAPPATTEIAFTDWQRLKAIEGIAAVNSVSMPDVRERIRKMLVITQERHAPMAGFGLAKFATFAKTWGWDTSDLAWEAMLNLDDEAPLYILQFRANFDMSALAERYRAYQFNERVLDNGITVFTSTVNIKAAWISGSELALRNSALDVKQHRLIVTSGDAGIAAAFAALNDKTARPGSVQRLAKMLARQASGILALPPHACERQRALNKLLKSSKAPALGAYETLAIGYDIVNGQPLGLIAMEYADPATAKTDAPIRLNIAKTGLSLATNRPYSDLITVKSSRVTGTAFMMTVHFREGQPRLLRDMMLRFDVAFAGCGE